MIPPQTTMMTADSTAPSNFTILMFTAMASLHNDSWDLSIAVPGFAVPFGVPRRSSKTFSKIPCFDLTLLWGVHILITSEQPDTT